MSFVYTVFAGTFLFDTRLINWRFDWLDGLFFFLFFFPDGVFCLNCFKLLKKC
jgi:hypothetical protein